MSKKFDARGSRVQGYYWTPDLCSPRHRPAGLFQVNVRTVFPGRKCSAVAAESSTGTGRGLSELLTDLDSTKRAVATGSKTPGQGVVYGPSAYPP